MSANSRLIGMNMATPDYEYEYDTVLLKIGCLLSSSYELIGNILKRLSYHDLVNVIQVCQAWSAVGNAILQKERRLRFITLHPEHLPTTDSEVSVNSVLPPVETLEKFLQQSSPETQICLGFAWGSWLLRNDIVTKYSPNGSSLDNLLKKALPKSCSFALVNVIGIIGTVENSSFPGKSYSNSSQTMSPKINLNLSASHNGGGPVENINMDSEDRGLSSCSDISEGRTSFHSTNNFNNVGYSIEIEEYLARSGPPVEMEALSVILLPRQPGVQVKIFKIDEKELYKTENSTEHLKRAGIPEAEFNHMCGLAPEDDLKAFLVFAHTLRRFTRTFISAAQSRQNDNVALGGGLIGVPQRDSFKGMVGVAISGSNVRTASIVIPSTVKNETALKNHLQKLKDCGLPEEHSVCFMFSCCGRGSYWYGKNNLETKAFKKLFPVTPILGFFGDGEIGNNYFNSSSDVKIDCYKGNARKKRKRKPQELFHQYSSVFVFISFL